MVQPQQKWVSDILRGHQKWYEKRECESQMFMTKVVESLQGVGKGTDEQKNSAKSQAQQAATVQGQYNGQPVKQQMVHDSRQQLFQQKENQAQHTDKSQHVSQQNYQQGSGQLLAQKDVQQKWRKPLVQQEEAFRNSRGKQLQREGGQKGKPGDQTERRGAGVVKRSEGGSRGEVALVMIGVAKGMEKRVVEKVKAGVGVDMRYSEQSEEGRAVKVLVNTVEEGARVIRESGRWVQDGWVVGWWRDVGGTRNRVGSGDLSAGRG